MISRSHVHEGGDRRDRRDIASLPAPAWTGSRVSSRRDSHGETSKGQEHLEPPSRWESEPRLIISLVVRRH